MVTRGAGILAMLAMSCGPSSSSSGCDFSTELNRHAGDAAEDCGVVALRASPLETDSCVIDAFNRKQAFFARYEQQGIDSDVAAGVASDSDGNVMLYTFDGDPSGGSHVGAAIWARTCNDALIDDAVPRGPDAVDELRPPIRCGSYEELGMICR